MKSYFYILNSHILNYRHGGVFNTLPSSIDLAVSNGDGVDNQTSIQGLYAIGETASTGVHGANRLASNSL